MTISFYELGLYAFALFVLFLTPGPVWVAIIARALTGGMRAAWPLAAGVVVGDALWPLLAVFGITWITGIYGEFLVALKWVAVVVFIVMGIGLLKGEINSLEKDNRLTRPGFYAGFIAGIAVILANPKAVLFYMGVLPGFFDLSMLTSTDIFSIILISMAVPFIGNLIMSYFVDRARRLLQSPRALRLIKNISGFMLIGVGIVIAFT